MAGEGAAQIYPQLRSQVESNHRSTTQTDNISHRREFPLFPHRLSPTRCSPSPPAKQAAALTGPLPPPHSPQTHSHNQLTGRPLWWLGTHWWGRGPPTILVSAPQAPATIFGSPRPSLVPPPTRPTRRDPAGFWPAPGCHLPLRPGLGNSPTHLGYLI